MNVITPKNVKQEGIQNSDKILMLSSLLRSFLCEYFYILHLHNFFQPVYRFQSQPVFRWWVPGWYSSFFIVWKTFFVPANSKRNEINFSIFYFTIFQLFLVPAADLPRAILKCVFLMATIYSLNVFIQMSAQSNPCVRACVLQYLLWEGKRPKLYFIVVYANS